TTTQQPSQPSTTTTTTTTVAPNVAPTLADDTRPVLIGIGSVDVDVLANDTDADGHIVPATLAIVSRTGSGTATVVNGVVRYTPPLLLGGKATIRYRACDDDGACSEAVLTVTVVLKL